MRLVSDTLVMTKRNLWRVWRTPQLLFFNSVQPVMFVLLFRYVFGGAISPPGFEARYVDFLIPGVLVQTMLFGGAGTAVGLAEDFSKGIVDRFRSLPMSRSAVLTGRALADVVRSLLVLVLMVAVGSLVGFRFHNGFWPPVLASVLLLSFGFAFSWYFALVALTVRDLETVQIAGFISVFPLTFASSAFVPVRAMPGWLQAFAKAQPVTQLVNATRSLTQGIIPRSTVAASRPALYSILYIVGLSIVFAALAIRKYRKG